MPSPTVVLSHDRDLSIAEVLAVAAGDGEVSLSPPTATLVDQRRREVVAHLRDSAQPAYGFNRGFGHNVDLSAGDDETQLAQAQLNLLRSHSCGVGERVPTRVVRMTMLLRAQSLARGASAVRSVVIQALVDLLNAGVTPYVPRHGSVSASGDLAPLAHVAAVLVGEGEVVEPTGDGERLIPGAKALAQASLKPVSLEMKEGLALLNGSQYLTALGFELADRLLSLLRTATASTSLASQLMLGSATPYREDLQALRPHPGAQVIARWLRELLAGSPMQAAHRDVAIDGEVQDPYNLRCAPQILGTCYDLIDEAQRTFVLEANSATDNPLVLPDEEGRFTDIVSGGHFHGMPVAVKIYNLTQAAAIMASLSNARCARYVDRHRNKGLGSDLIWPSLNDAERGGSSGLMVAEYASASLTNWIWGQTMPSHLFSIATDCGQEDHVSMGAPLALRLLDTLPELERVLALELAFCAQAAGLRRQQSHFPSKANLPEGAEAQREALRTALVQAVSDEEGTAVDVEVRAEKRYRWTPDDRRLSPAGERLIELLLEAFPVLRRDRALSPGVEALAKLVRSRRIDQALSTWAGWHE